MGLSKFEKFKENLSKNLKPKPTLWSLAGIFLIFFLPEIVAYFYGEKIVIFINDIKNSTNDPFLKKVYESLKIFSENSLFNILLGFLTLIWWIYERKQSKK